MNRHQTQSVVVEGKNNALFLLRGYNALLQPYRVEYALILLGIATQIVFYVLYPLLFKSIFDRAIPDKNFSLLTELIVEVCILLVFSSVGAFIQIRYMARVGGRVLGDMRRAMAYKLNALGFAFYSQVESVDLLSRFSTDMERIENSLTRALPSLVEGVMVTLGCLLTILFIDWRMGLAALVLLPVGFIGNAMFGAKEDALNSQSRSLKNHMLLSVEDFSKSWHLIHAYNDQQQFRNRFEQVNASYTKSSSDHSYYIYIAPVFSDYGINVSLTAIVLVGAVLAMNGGLTVGAFIGCFALLRKVADGSGKTAKSYAAYVNAVRPYKRVQKLLSEPVCITELPNAIELAPLASEIRFREVSYSYAPGKPVLSGLNFAIKAGTSLAIVGPSGSGKSTILKLIMRIIDPTAGVILFDGVNVRQATLESVRRGMASVLQDSHIIRGSIAENLRFAKPDATDAEVVEAARKADIHEFIMSLSHGYETLVDDRGSSLSGGQRQRIAIARALLLNAPIIFLDEPTSMLDPITETLINRTIAQLTSDRTVIMSTHRLSSARNMHRILVLDAYAVVESGSHSELMDKNGLYRNMWEKQQGFTIDAEGFVRISPERLREIPIFSSLGMQALGELAEQFSTETFEPGTTIIREGDQGNKFYIVVRGNLQVLKKDALSVDQPLRIMQDGDHFGEIALLRWVARTASVCTLTNTQCLSLSRERFIRLVESQPDLQQALEVSVYDRG